MDDLVKNLSSNTQKVILEENTKTNEEIYDRIKQGFVFIKFTQTRGTGTEVGINITNSNIDEIENKNIPNIEIEGKTKLNFHPIIIKAKVDMESRQGTAEVSLEESNK